VIAQSKHVVEVVSFCIASHFYPKSTFAEHVWCSLKLRDSSNLLIGVYCYRSPNKGIFHDDNGRLLRKLINEVGSRQLLRIGDFNYPEVDWLNLRASSVASQMFVYCL